MLGLSPFSRPTGFYMALHRAHGAAFPAAATSLQKRLFSARQQDRRALNLLSEIPLPKPTFGLLDEEAEQKREVEAVTIPLTKELAAPEVTPGGEGVTGGGDLAKPDDDRVSCDPTTEDLSPWRPSLRYFNYHKFGQIPRQYIKTRFGTFIVG